MMGPEAVTSRLVTFAAHAGFESIPSEVRAKVPLHLLDFIAVAAAGSVSADSSEAVRAAIDALEPAGSPEGTCTVIAEPRRRGPEHAAFLNGTWAHSLDFDDTTIVAALHPGAPVIPAVLALAEAHHKDGVDVLTAIAVGYEVMCRIGTVMGTAPYDRGFHPTAIAGVFGATAAAGNLLGLDPSALESALGLAGSMAAGSMQYLEDGSHNKRLHPGFAARNAVLAVSLASHGVVGAKASLEGRRGAFLAYGAERSHDQATAGLGEDWVMLETGIKPYPACRLTHGAVDAALTLRDAVPDIADRVQEITVGLHPRAIDLVGQDELTKHRPVTTVDGQFSVWFQVAVSLLDGAPGWGSYGRMGDPDVHALIDRIRVVRDETLPAPGADLSILLPEGTRRQRVEVPAGEPGPSLNLELVATKLSAATQSLWSDDHREQLTGLVENLHLPGAFEELAPLLRAAN